MRRLAALSTILVALALPTLAQTPRTTPDLTGPTAGATTSPNGNVSAVGRKMPPTTGRTPSTTVTAPKGADKNAAGNAIGGKTGGATASDTKVSDAKARAATEVEMLKAQKAAEERNKAWDARMRKTMGSICSGC